MATITMDTSEYEAMKEIKKVLEDSLERERGLQKKVEKLTKEKIQVLEDAKMKVVKVVKNETTQHLLEASKAEAGDILREIEYIFTNRSYNSGANQFDTYDISRLRDALFTKVTFSSMSQVETTLHGLDEIKVEIREDLKSKMDLNIKESLKKAEQVLIFNKELIERNSQFEKENKSLLSKNKLLLRNYEKLNNELTNINKESEIISKIRNLLKNGYKITGKSKLLDTIISLIKEKE